MGGHVFCHPPRRLLLEEADILTSPACVDTLTKNVAESQNVRQFQLTYTNLKSIAQFARMHWRDKKPSLRERPHSYNPHCTGWQIRQNLLVQYNPGWCRFGVVHVHHHHATPHFLHVLA